MVIRATPTARPQAGHGLLPDVPPRLPVPEAEPMSGVDRAWLEMDEPCNPMIVSSIMEFAGVRDLPALAQHLVENLLRQRRFRQHPVEGPYRWVEDEALHLGYHLRVHRLPPHGGGAALRAAIGEELSHELDRALPLWRITLFPTAKGHVTALFRAHHALADGVALMQLMLRIADGGDPAHAAPENGVAPARGPLRGMIRRLESANALLDAVGTFLSDDLRHPRRIPAQLHEARRAAAAIARVLTLPDDNPRCLRAPLCGRRVVAWTGELSFPAVRRLAHRQGVTINDIFLAALAGAFGRHLRAAESALPEDQNLRVSVPVNLRSDGDDSLGNNFGLVLVDLPVGLEGPHARIDVVAERMASLKQSSEARAVLGTLAAAGHLPVAAEKPLVNYVSGKAAAVVSNLPGPRHAIRFGGATLANVVFWPPQASRIGVGVSFLSYAGRISVGVSSDIAVLAHPQELVDGFCAELEAMLGASPFVKKRAGDAASRAQGDQGPPHAPGRPAAARVHAGLRSHLTGERAVPR